MSKKFPVNAPCPCGSGKKYKKCHGSARTAERTPLLRTPETFGQDLIAYTDESGNSGNHLFDPNQPEFWTGTLVTPPNFETIASPVVAECLAIVGQPELHGNALGLSGIDKIGDKLGRLFAKTGAKFLFTKIDKGHFAATKFADTLLDSGTNQAMGLAQYGPPATRLPLALQLIQLLEKDDIVRWWKAFETNDGVAFSEMMKIPLERLELLHQEKIYDDRTAQLLRDARTWGMAHPRRLMEGGFGPLHAPNVVAITLIVDMLHTLHEQTGARVVKFIHDEQNQYIKHLKLIHDHSKRFQLDTSQICSPLPVVRGALTFDCNLESAQSTNRVGLQLIDTVLWLIRRFLKTKGEITGHARRLAVYVVATGEITTFDRPTMIEHTKRVLNELYNLPISDKQMNDGMKLAREVEEKRVARMNSPIDDE
jgi:SEC-C motif/Protein of unknown function (DUF3800)